MARRLTSAELAAALAALEWVGRRADLAKILAKTEVMRGLKKPPAVTPKHLKAAANFLKFAAARGAQDDQIAKGMKIKKWVQTGELDGSAGDTKELLDEVCNILDSACTADILGINLFQGSDGRYYTVTVEAEIGEASDGFVNDVLQDLYEEGEDDDSDTVPDRNDGEDGPPEVLEVSVRGEGPILPFVPPEDPDPRPGPRFGPPPTPAAVAAELKQMAEARGAPVAKPPTEYGPTPISELLDRVEAEAVAGADALEAEAEVAKALSEQAATVAGVALGRPVPPDELKAAWAEYGGRGEKWLRYEIANVTTQAAPLTASSAHRDELNRRLDRLRIALAVRTWVADLGGA